VEKGQDNGNLGSIVGELEQSSPIGRVMKMVKMAQAAPISAFTPGDTKG
jgi:hypothetical protein